MSVSVSPRDFELISAYIDGALSPRELASFTERLGNEPELGSALKSLQRTRAVLRAAPRRHTLRSFALQPQMVEAQRGNILAGWNSLNFASAVATLLLAFVLIGDFALNGAPIVVGAPSEGEAPQAFTAPAATPTPTPEIQLFAQEDRQAKGGETAFDWNLLFAQYARDLELGLGGIAIASGLLAWQRKKRG